MAPPVVVCSLQFAAVARGRVGCIEYRDCTYFLLNYLLTHRVYYDFYLAYSKIVTDIKRYVDIQIVIDKGANIQIATGSGVGIVIPDLQCF